MRSKEGQEAGGTLQPQKKRSRSIAGFHVRFGSLADILISPCHVRFTPNNGRWAAHPSQHFWAVAASCSSMQRPLSGPTCRRSTRATGSLSRSTRPRQAGCERPVRLNFATRPSIGAGARARVFLHLRAGQGRCGSPSPRRPLLLTDTSELKSGRPDLSSGHVGPLRTLSGHKN